MTGAAGAARGRDTALFLAAALASAALLFWVIEDRVFALIFAAGLLGAGGVVLLFNRRTRGDMAIPAQVASGIEPVLLRAALDASDAAMAVTDGAERLISANRLWGECFGGGAAPVELDAALATGAQAARREGTANVPRLVLGSHSYAADARAIGSQGWLLWRIERAGGGDPVAEGIRLLHGESGRRLGEAGVMVALTDSEGRIHAANAGFVHAACGGGLLGHSTLLQIRHTQGGRCT